ncbi:elongation factor P-like protein YeiP [Zooshikella ganghwensis]|uniref:elongation factor P-like protein EfpL n=1 Tax=Zooshikella ganghwensis TaxID=202772 RepID=UPI0003FEE4C9|nr:elongation factor P-like protein YeiP [Zooshikella ganghwensis]
MPKASDLAKGHVININNSLGLVRDIEVNSPSSRGAQTLYKVRFTLIPSQQKLEKTYTGDDWLDDADFQRRQCTLLFREDNLLTFMDTENYEQYSLAAADIGQQVYYLPEENQEITLLLVNNQAIALELPTTVVLTITDTSPGIKGATATGRTKPATLSSGLEIQVPEYITTGEKVKVNTSTGKFMSRA